MAISLEKQYFDPEHEAGFVGAAKLVKLNKNFTPKYVKDWLTKQDAYTLHKPIRKKFPRLYYNVSGLDQLWEIDLIILNSLKSYNDGFSYLLAVIDVLSKFAFVEPLRDKTTAEVTKAFKKILDNNKYRFPRTVQSDAGKEFVGSTMQNFFKQNGIQFRIARNPDVKAAVVERFIRTLKERMFRYLTFKNTKRYIDVLPAIVKAYNNTVHTTIKMKPAAVTLYNARKAWKNLQRVALKRQIKRKKPKYKAGQYVRISRERNIFKKGYEKGWSDEIFKIQKVIKRQNLFIYELCDLDGENIEGFFYPEELSVVHRDRVLGEEFQIEKILKTRGTGARKEFLVSWVGYPQKFDSWVKAKDLKKL